MLQCIYTEWSMKSIQLYNCTKLYYYSILVVVSCKYSVSMHILFLIGICLVSLKCCLVSECMCTIQLYSCRQRAKERVMKENVLIRRAQKFSFKEENKSIPFDNMWVTFGANEYYDTVTAASPVALVLTSMTRHLLS